MLRQFTLQNGIHVATYQMPTIKSLHLGFSLKAGSLVESAADNGVAHFMEHMLVQGIPSFPTAEKLSSYIESLAGRYGASTSQMIVHFSLTVPFSHLEDAVKIASEVFFQPLFPEAAIEKERSAVLNELKQHLDSRWYKFNQFYRANRYASNSPLQRETIGKEEIIRKLTREDLLRYYTTYFHPDNMYLFIGGNFAEKQLRELLERYMEKPKKKIPAPVYPRLSNTADLAKKQLAIRHDSELQVNYLNFSFPALNSLDPIRTIKEQSIALIILGQLRTSRLFKLLRYQKGLVYGVTASDVFWPGAGYAYIDSEVAPEHLDEVISLIIAQLKKFVVEGPSEDELEFTKHYLSNQWLMAFDNPAAISNWVEGEFLWRDKIRLPEEYIELINKLYVSDIKQVMQEHWNVKQLNLILQGPLQNTKENKDKYTQMLEPLR